MDFYNWQSQPPIPASEIDASTDLLLLRDMSKEENDNGLRSVKVSTLQAAPGALFIWPINVGDQSTNLTAATNKWIGRAPFAFRVTAVRCSVMTAPVGSTIIVDINNATNSFLSTKLTIVASEKTSTTAAAPAVIDAAQDNIADDAEISIDIDQIGSGTAGAGLKVVIYGVRE